jgi:hypothetical protein
VTLRREDWQQIIDACAGAPFTVEQRRRMVTALFVETGMDPTPPEGTP